MNTPITSDREVNKLWIDCAQQLAPNFCADNSPTYAQYLHTLISSGDKFILAYAHLGWKSFPQMPAHEWHAAFCRMQRLYALTDLGAACYCAAAAGALTASLRRAAESERTD